MISTQTAMAGSYDYRTVALSVLMAIAASYAALDLAGRVTAASGWVRSAWLVSGAGAMGLGIWSMHFIAMLAFSLPVPISYHWLTVLLALLAALFASAVALYVVSRQKMSFAQAVVGGTVMGLGIVALHYIGMAAMRLTAVPRFDPRIVTLSVVLAIVFSFIALLLAFDLRKETRETTPRKIGSALAVAAGICLMHYTGMAAVSFVPATVIANPSRAVSISALGTAAIGTVTLMVLGLAILTSSVDRRFHAQALELARGEARMELARIARIATLGELAASIAHEINQPLAAVGTNASASLRWLAQQPPNLEEAREAAKRTVREANRASEVIANTRALLKKETGRTEQLQINEVIQEVLVLTQQELVRDGITVQTELAPEVPTLFGDRVQLQQVMLNLIMNAIDAMAVTAEGPRDLIIKSATVPEGVLVQVQDFGKGVAAQEAERIFEPFFTTKPQGIGMGLSISRSIIEAHGGRMWVTPGSPRGAVFQFILPNAKSPT
jgi:NO-binding membrane sensor protein with MHYT domain